MIKTVLQGPVYMDSTNYSQVEVGRKMLLKALILSKVRRTWQVILTSELFLIEYIPKNNVDYQEILDSRTQITRFGFSHSVIVE